MSRRVERPSEARVRQALSEVAARAEDNGKKPTVLALARELGMSNATFWRHFPDIAREVVDLARSLDKEEMAVPTRYEQLREEHARLKRDHAQLAHDLELAKAVIQRLALENRSLREQAKAMGTVIPLRRQP